MCLPKSCAVLEVELLLAALLDRLGELEAVLPGELGDVRAELLVDEHPGRFGVYAALDGDLHALEDQLLGVGDRLGLLGRRIALDAEHLLLERAPVVEGEDVELSVVAECHGNHLCRTGRGGHRLPSRAVEPNFTGPSYTVGIEEELMILDPQTWELANAIEGLLEDSGSDDDAGGIKPELHESVLEIATQPCRDVHEAGAELRGLRRQVAEVGVAARPHDRLRRHPPVRALGGPADLGPPALPRPDRHAALRRAPGGHLRPARPRRDRRRRQGDPRRQWDARPRRRCCSRCRPTRRSGAATSTGLASARMPIFRQFPRVGMPPAYKDWADFERRIGFMVDSKVMDDYTYLWYDVRPHPNFGTVEIRGMDAQTRIEHTLAIAALIQAMVKELAEHFEAGEALADYPYEMLDENRWIAARHGLDGELVDLPELRAGPDEGARQAALRPARRARAGPRLGLRARGHPRPARGRQRRHPPAGRLRGQPRPSGGRARDRGGHRARLGRPLSRRHLGCA